MWLLAWFLPRFLFLVVFSRMFQSKRDPKLNFRLKIINCNFLLLSRVETLNYFKFSCSINCCSNFLIFDWYFLLVLSNASPKVLQVEKNNVNLTSDEHQNQMRFWRHVRVGPILIKSLLFVSSNNI